MLIAGVGDGLTTWSTARKWGSGGSAPMHSPQGALCTGRGLLWMLASRKSATAVVSLHLVPHTPQSSGAAALWHFSPMGFKGSGKADCYPSPSPSRRAKTKLKLQVWVQGMSSWERVFLPHCHAGMPGQPLEKGCRSRGWAELLGGAARRRVSTRGWGPGVCCPQPRPPTKRC